MTIEDLKKWDEKFRELQSKIKILEREKQGIKLELDEKSRLLEKYTHLILIKTSYETRAKISTEGVEERSKTLQTMVDELTKKNTFYENKVSKIENNKVKA